MEVDTPISAYIETYSGEPRDGVTRDVAFNRHSFGQSHIYNPDQNHIYTGTDGIKVTLEQDFDDDELRHFFSWCINATRGIDPNNPPDEVDWEEMMKGGLQTAIKRINIAFAVSGASRTCTHQLVRSTRANFHQQSQRAHYYGDRPSVRMPESFLKGHGEVADRYNDLVEHAAEFYRFACEHDVSYQDARFGLLEGTTNFIMCEYSLHEFMAVYDYRACSMFQWEIVYIFREMKRVLVEAHPWLEPYIKISCERTRGAKDEPSDDEAGDKTMQQYQKEMASGIWDHHCTFQGWETVEGQCDFPWARETNRVFRSDRHRIEAKK
jgi:thymidylate synthase ThyX